MSIRLEQLKHRFGASCNASPVELEGQIDIMIALAQHVGMYDAASWMAANKDLMGRQMVDVDQLRARRKRYGLK